MFIGMLLAVLSGVCLGVCFLPMRYMTKFAWENTWFVWVISGCLIFPPIIAYLTIPSLFQVLEQVGLRLKLQEGLSYREISEVTGLSISNVGFLLHKGIRSIREQFAH